MLFCLFTLCTAPSLKKRARVTCRDGTIYGKNSTFGYFDGAKAITGESIKLRYPTPIMASVDNHQTTNFISVFYFYLSGHELITTADWANLGRTLTD